MNSYSNIIELHDLFLYIVCRIYASIMVQSVLRVSDSTLSSGNQKTLGAEASAGWLTVLVVSLVGWVIVQLANRVWFYRLLKYHCIHWTKTAVFFNFCRLQLNVVVINYILLL